MKKIKIVCLSIAIVGVTIFSTADSHLVLAADFEGNEEAWQNRCAVAQSTSAKAQECASFKEYLASKSGALEGEVKDLNKQVAKIKDNIEEISAAVKQQDKLIKEMAKQIEVNEASIRTISEQIDILVGQIKLKEEDIEKRNKLIMDRMVGGQVDIGTNMEIEVLMGASDLVDLIRKVEGLQRITESDQEEINKLSKEKEELSVKKSESDRLKQDAEDKKEENERNKKNEEEIKKAKQKLLDEYLKQEASLNEKMRAVEVDMNSIRNNIINISTAVAGDISFGGNGALLIPVNGPTAAGTWAYNGGGVHLGWDISPGVGSPIIAPNDGIILYASNPVSTYNGYIGNSSGFPAGAGNSVHMLTQANGRTYGISFFHMAQENFVASPGMQVKRGQTIGAVGSSGNVTGPHAHIEVVDLGSMSIQAGIERFQRTAEFDWGTGWGVGALANICEANGGRTPCRVRPEKVMG